MITMIVYNVRSFELSENLWGSTGVDAVVEIQDLFKTGFCCLRLSSDPSVAIIQQRLGTYAVVIATLLLDLHGRVDQVLLLLLLLLALLGLQLLDPLHRSHDCLQQTPH